MVGFLFDSLDRGIFCWSWLQEQPSAVSLCWGMSKQSWMKQNGWWVHVGHTQVFRTFGCQVLLSVISCINLLQLWINSKGTGLQQADHTHWSGWQNHTHAHRPPPPTHTHKTQTGVWSFKPSPSVSVMFLFQTNKTTNECYCTKNIVVQSTYMLELDCTDHVVKWTCQFWLRFLQQHLQKFVTLMNLQSITLVKVII